MSKVHPINKKDMEKLNIIKYFYFKRIKPSLCWKIKRFYKLFIFNRKINIDKDIIIKKNKFEEKKIEPNIIIV